MSSRAFWLLVVGAVLAYVFLPRRVHATVSIDEDGVKVRKGIMP